MGTRIGRANLEPFPEAHENVAPSAPIRLGLLTRVESEDNALNHIFFTIQSHLLRNCPKCAISLKGRALPGLRKCEVINCAVFLRVAASMKSDGAPTDRMHFGAYEVDLCAGELLRNGTKLKLQEQPFQILQILLEKPGALVTREELRERIWLADTHVDFDHSLYTAITKLREALHDSSEHPRFIETVPRRGYRFIAQVTKIEVAKVPAEPGPGAWAGLLRPLRLGATGARLIVLASGVSMALVVAVLLFRSLHEHRASGLRKVQSLAVLPLENLSHDPEQEYFAEGMTDELITDLAQIRALRVISRGSVAQYKAKRPPTPQIARELNVDALVEGTVLRSGSRVRISAQLIDARTDRHLWAQTYERDLLDVLALQDEVAEAIASEIEIKLTSREQERLRSAHPVNLEANDLYLKGRYFWNKRTEEGLKKGLEYFQRAIQVDPRYPLGHAGLADAYAVSAYRGYLAPQEGYPKAKAAALKALELDDSLAEAHTTLAAVTGLYDHDWQGAEREFRRAIELNPGYANAHHWYALQLDEMGRPDESIAEINRALELDPLSLIINANAVVILYHARRYDQAIEQLRNAREIDLMFDSYSTLLGLVYEQKGMYKEAVAELKKGVGSSEVDSFSLGALGHVYAVAGERKKALKIVEELKALSKQRHVDPRAMAEVYVGLGDKDQTIAWLEEVYREGSYGLRADPRFDRLRSDPRFQALLRRAGLTP
jgi:TolB-like protein/DNA-binding winged helix-turn-helix (wHTH) protein/Tfp pilus assembly protein PilF